ncbi:hydrolase [Amycolatopsis magusensis]|uniref:alpha/beta hydrolase n=1 Tax=Amycolatopsis magusensis TaxID=882444 RepID=UPI0024A9B3B3|nr:hydrolase [Amycolatopsis magusensis]MDI5978963.1 hydrolase [Amycolatopsis magusensis]
MTSVITKRALPRPSGPHTPGRVALRLVDWSRPDPWVPDQPFRELMVSLWYPSAGGGRPARYLGQGAAATASTDDLDLTAIDLHSVDGAAVLRGEKRPVLVFSPDLGSPRDFHTSLVEDLTSHGYVVVTIDHTYETAVDFPGGRIAGRRAAKQAHLEARVEDVQTVLAKLTSLAEGRIPGDGILPPWLGSVLDLGRLGVFGHGAGGGTTAEAMYRDIRLRAGVVLDGAPLPSTGGHDRPILLLGSEGAQTPEAFWARHRGWKRELKVLGTTPLSFTDYEPLLPHDPARLGPTSPGRVVTATRTHLRAFFDLHLRRRPTRLFDGPLSRCPEVVVIR